MMKKIMVLVFCSANAILVSAQKYQFLNPLNLMRQTCLRQNHYWMKTPLLKSCINLYILWWIPLQEI